nr:hypothetical protein [Pseudomonas sp.]
MAVATASQPEISIIMVIVRLISASSLPCGTSKDSLAVLGASPFKVFSF